MTERVKYSSHFPKSLKRGILKVDDKYFGENPLIIDVLKLLTPREIVSLSYIYQSLNRVSLSSILDLRLELEMEEKGFKSIAVPPPLFELKKWKREDPLPSVIDKEKTRGGSSFILAEREKLKKSNKLLGQMKVLALYNEVANSGKETKILTQGILINKKSA